MLSGAITPSCSGFLRYMPSALDVYLHYYKDYLEMERFNAMPSNGDAETVYNARNGLYGDTALGAWVRRWTHWDGHGAVLRANDTRYVDMLFVRFGEHGYASQMTAIISQYYSLSDEDLPSAGLKYIC